MGKSISVSTYPSTPVPLLVLCVVLYFVISVPYLVLVPMPVLMLVLVLGVLVPLPLPLPLLLLLYVPVPVALHISHQRHSLPSVVLPWMLDFPSYLTSTKPQQMPIRKYPPWRLSKHLQREPPFARQTILSTKCECHGRPESPPNPYQCRFLLLHHGLDVSQKKPIVHHSFNGSDVAEYLLRCHVHVENQHGYGVRVDGWMDVELKKWQPTIMCVEQILTNNQRLISR